MSLDDYMDKNSGSSTGIGVKNPNAKYKDREWLRHKVLDEEKSSKEIASDFDVTGRTIRNWMNNFGITQKDILCDSISFCDYQIDVIEGTVLGDAGFYTKTSGYGNAIYKLANLKTDYLEYVVSLMPDKMFTDNYRREKGIDSRAFPKLSELNDMWYGSNGKRLPREDFCINSNKLLHWYICDGTLGESNPVIDAVWCSPSGAKHLSRQISKLVGGCNLHNYERYGRKEWKFIIPSGYEDSFFDTIGSAPVKGYKYKWR